MNDGEPAAVARRLWWVSQALQAGAVVSAAHRLGLLAALEASPARVEDLARDRDLHAPSTAVLLEALVAMGLLESSEDGYLRAAVPGLPTLGATADSADLLVQVVRSGRAPLGCDAPPGATRVYPGSVALLATLVADAAAAVADLLYGAERTLDVGAGAAPWSLAVARRNPRCRVTALDLPAVLPVTRRAVDAADCADRFDYIAGDLFEVRLPSAPYDLVLLGNVCHLFDEHTNLRLFRRLRPAIRPGGRIAVIDVMPSPDWATRRAVGLYAAGLMTRTADGGVHGQASYRQWLEGAGFHDIRLYEASRTPPASVAIGSV